MTVRVEVVTPCEHGKEGHMVELDTGEFRPCPSGASRRSFTEWPPEAIEAAARAVWERNNDGNWSHQKIARTGSYLAALHDAQACLAAAWGHITGDNK